mgnify:FL=1
MPIKIISNTGNPIFTSAQGLATNNASQAAVKLVDLHDVNKAGLNDNDIMVYDSFSGKFVPIDKDIINNNDGGEF